MRGPLLCAVSLDAATGGVAQVSRMLWLALTSTWGDRARLVRLCPDGRVHSTAADRGAFCLRLAREQVLRPASWVLFTHLDLLRALAVVPPRLRRPYGVFLHGVEAWAPLSPRLQHLLRGAALRIANSNFTARRAMERHPEIGPVVACPLALPPGAEAGVETAGENPPLAIGPSAVLIVGRMLAAERYKGHDQMIDAWPRVLERVPDAQLVVVGHGDDAARLRARAERSGAGNTILFPGFVNGESLRGLYGRCAVFAMPSRGEGFGLVYLEAMAHRLPCIGSRDDAASEIIVDGETGLLVDQSDVRALGDAIVRLLVDRDLRVRMGAAGFERLRGQFSPERFSARVVSCLRGAFETAATSRVQPSGFAS